MRERGRGEGGLGEESEEAVISGVKNVVREGCLSLFDEICDRGGFSIRTAGGRGANGGFLLGLEKGVHSRRKDWLWRRTAPAVGWRDRPGRDGEVK